MRETTTTYLSQISPRHNKTTNIPVTDSIQDINNHNIPTMDRSNASYNYKKLVVDTSEP